MVSNHCPRPHLIFYINKLYITLYLAKKNLRSSKYRKQNVVKDLLIYEGDFLSNLSSLVFHSQQKMTRSLRHWLPGLLISEPHFFSINPPWLNSSGKLRPLMRLNRSRLQLNAAAAAGKSAA